jgi:two-component system nitrogen regulation sensor histidine kinase GlnL
LNPNPRFVPFDLLATLVVVADQQGQVIFANSAFEEVMEIPRRSIEGASLLSLFAEKELFENVLKGAREKDFATFRFDAHVKSLAKDDFAVHVILVPLDEQNDILIELLPLDKQNRIDKEERILDQAQANKELIRNLAHEIKNPLGGIRGAAQLLEMEIESRDLIEYTQVIIREADRLQALVDRLLAPHRKPHVVAPVNIHDVCERVRSLILAEFPKGLEVVRDYDISIPDFRGDVEQLIQAILNLVHNAAQALSEQIANGQGKIRLKTRIARQVTFGKQTHRLALELHVLDNGPGIPESIKDRLFSPLVSGRDGGSGLGLNLAQTFIQQHSGVIECESEPGKTDFMILIPLP